VSSEPPRLNFWKRLEISLAKFELAHVGRPRQRAILVGGRVGLGWFSASVGLEGSTGILLLLAALLMLFGKENSGTGLAYLGLLLTFTAVNLLAFYFEQFSTILPAMIEFILLLGVLHYRRLYLLGSQVVGGA
jgi:hypothetical protein